MKHFYFTMKDKLRKGQKYIDDRSGSVTSAMYLLEIKEEKKA